MAAQASQGFRARHGCGDRRAEAQLRPPIGQVASPHCSCPNTAPGDDATLPYLTRAARAAVDPSSRLLAGCTPDDQGSNLDPEQVDAVTAPELGACRLLTPDDVTQTSNATRAVDCTEKHTAETYAVGRLPTEFDDAAYDAKDLGIFAYRRCSEGFQEFVGADESLAMRTVVSWAWFRPSEKAWQDGARWYRCDVIGGGDQTEEYLDLPVTAEGLLTERPDAWLVCVDGPTVNGMKLSCDQPHTWRAVTTIKLGRLGRHLSGRLGRGTTDP